MQQHEDRILLPFDPGKTDHLIRLSEDLGFDPFPFRVRRIQFITITGPAQYLDVFIHKPSLDRVHVVAYGPERQAGFFGDLFQGDMGAAVEQSKNNIPLFRVDRDLDGTVHNPSQIDFILSELLCTNYNIL